VGFFEEVEALLQVAPESEKVGLVGMRCGERLKARVGEAGGEDFDGHMRGRRRGTIPTGRNTIFCQRHGRLGIVAGARRR